MRGISPTAQDKWLRRHNDTVARTLDGRIGASSIAELVETKPHKPKPPSKKLVPFTKGLICLIGRGMVYGGHRNHSSQNTFKVCVAKISKRHQMSATEMLGKCRSRRCVLARQDLMHELSLNGWGLSAIGRRMNLDHTTILHGLRAFAKRSAA
jgi:hypothetical protein